MSTIEDIQKQLESLEEEFDNAKKELEELNSSSRYTPKERELQKRVQVVERYDKRLEQYMDKIKRAADAHDKRAWVKARARLRDTLKARKKAFRYIESLEKEIEERRLYLKNRYLGELERKIIAKNDELKRAARDEERKQRKAA